MPAHPLTPPTISATSASASLPPSISAPGTVPTNQQSSRVVSLGAKRKGVNRIRSTRGLTTHPRKALVASHLHKALVFVGGHTHGFVYGGLYVYIYPTFYTLFISTTPLWAGNMIVVGDWPHFWGPPKLGCSPYSRLGNFSFNLELDFLPRLPFYGIRGDWPHLGRRPETP